MTVKQNTHSSPIDNLSFLDNFIFILKLIVFVSFSILLIIVTLLLGKRIPIFGKWLPVIFHKLLIWLLSVRIELEGKVNISNDCNLYISNHLSYLDIPILGSIYPVRFIAKSEVENWPLFGCASFPGTDVQKFSKEFSYLRSNFSLQDEMSVKSLVNSNYPVYNRNNINESDLRIFVKLPPLIKGYLRVGGRVSDGFFIDYDFNTIDLCVVVQTENIDEKYKNKFLN